MNEFRPRWYVVDGSEVTTGDYVALDVSPDSLGKIVGVACQGLPNVELLNGPDKGQVRAMYPGQILTIKSGLSGRAKGPSGSA